jgi:hypothetical protein
MSEEPWDRDQVGPAFEHWRELMGLEPGERRYAETPDISYPRVFPMWGNLLQSCGYTEIRPALLAKIESVPGGDPPKGSVNDVLVMQPSAAHWLADQIEELFVAAYPDDFRRPGDTMFSSDALDKLAAAGCVLEDLDSGGVTIHLPATGGSIDGLPIAQMMSPRLEARELMSAHHYFSFEKPLTVPNGPDYLKHDPTKRHSRKRPTTKRNRHR